MTSDASSFSLPTKLLIRFVLTILFVAVLSRYLPEYFVVQGGVFAYLVIGALLTLLNIFVRPILKILAFPLKLFATLTALILVNGIFIFLIYFITQQMDSSLVMLQIGGGIVGWILVSILLGFGNWLIKLIIR